MDLIASFSSQKVNTFNFFSLRGLFGERDIFFLFDTGAACPIIGVNSFFRSSENADHPTDRQEFETLLNENIVSQGISPRPKPLETANRQRVKTFPCVCHHVTIDNVLINNFFFDISFEEISIPLLGSSFSDDCSYSHAINGNIHIIGMNDIPGENAYAGLNVLDFDEVVKAYRSKAQ